MQKNYAVIFSLIFMVYFNGCEKLPTAPETTGTINGRVINLTTGNALSDVAISTNPRTSTIVTGSDGFFILTDLDPDQYTILAQKDGYNDNSVTVTVVPGDETVADITLKEKSPEADTTGSISGKVTDSKTGNAISGVAVSTNPPTSTIQTGSDGFFSLTDLDPTQYTILAQKDGYNDNSVTVTVAADNETVADITLKEKAPELELTLSSLNFGTASGQETLGIKNKGIGTVNWSIEENLDWLQVSPASGSVTTETDFVTISLNRTGLDYGNYQSTIMVRSNGGELSVDIIMVVLNPDAPQLTINKAVLDFDSTKTDLDFTISNTGTGDLNWTISADKNWISLDPTASINDGSVTVKVQRRTLVAGAHNGKILINSNGGSTEINVRISVADPPQLTISTAELEFDSTKTNLDFTVSNTGAGELSWTLSKDKSWISLNPTAGTNDGSVTVAVDGQSLGTGEHTGKITINSNGGSAQITVQISVPEAPDAPQLTVNKTELEFDSTKTNLDFTVSNTGSGDLSWTVSKDKNWIALNPTAGTNGGSVTVAVDGQSLGAGDHTGKLTINSNGGSTEISVRLYVPDSGWQTIPAPTLEEPYNITENSITLAWSIITHNAFQEYRLYRSTSPGASETSNLVTTITNAYQNTYDDTGLEDGTTYYYRVYSVNNSGDSFGSNEVSAVTLLGVGTWGLVNSFGDDVYLYAIYAFSDDNVWVVGAKNSRSIIYHYVNNVWLEITPPYIGVLYDVDFASTTYAWAAGNDGFLYFNGSIWQAITDYGGANSVSVLNENSIWFSNGTKIIDGKFSDFGLSGVDIEMLNESYGLLYGNGTIYKYDGFSWSSFFDGSGYYYPVDGTPGWGTDNITIVDNDIFYWSASTYPSGVFLYDHGDVSTVLSDVNVRSYSVHAISQNNVWCSSEAKYGYSDQLKHWNGSAIDLTVDTQTHIRSMSFFSERVGWACGGQYVYRYNN